MAPIVLSALIPLGHHAATANMVVMLSQAQQMKGHSG